MHQEGTTDAAVMEVMSVWSERYPDRNFLTELFRKVEEQTAADNKQTPTDEDAADAPVEAIATEETPQPVAEDEAQAETEAMDEADAETSDKTSDNATP